MEDRKLQELLTELHDQLEDVNAVEDESTRELMRDVRNDIRNLLDKPAEEREEDHLTLRDRLAGSVERFEAAHPRLALTVGQVINSLSNAGI